MKTSNPDYACVSSAVGGSVSRVSLGGNITGNRVTATHGESTKGSVRGFSSKSRMNLLRRMASINRSAFREYEGRLISVALTYPREWPGDAEACKKHLKALRKRLKRRYGEFSAYWRLGIQQRGAWHFHLLLFVPPSFGSVAELRDFIASSWYEITGKLSEGHLLAGTHVQEVRKWRSATSYMEKYVAKPEVFPEGVETGRVWGTWNPE
jgi:hypothetical protein